MDLEADNTLSQDADTGGTDTTLAAGADTASEPVSVAAAIDQALGYDKPPEVEAKADAPKLGADGKPADAPKLDANGKPIVDAKPKGSPDYTPPAGLSQEAQRRFQTLVGDNKTMRAENEKLKAQTEQFTGQQQAVQGFQQIFDDCKMQPDQFGLAVDFIKAVNTQDYGRAEQILIEEMRQLSLRTGRDLSAPDALAGFPDLKQAVADGQATRAHALELAKGRAAQQQQTQQRQVQERFTQQQEATSKQIDAGGKAVNEWCARMATADIDWPAKSAKLEAELDFLAENVPPTQWVAHLERFYRMINVAPAAQRRGPAPLRANGGAGNAKAAPGSMLEAIDGGLGYGQ